MQRRPAQHDSQHASLGSEPTAAFEPDSGVTHLPGRLFIFACELDCYKLTCVFFQKMSAPHTHTHTHTHTRTFSSSLYLYPAHIPQSNFHSSQKCSLAASTHRHAHNLTFSYTHIHNLNPILTLHTKGGHWPHPQPALGSLGRVRWRIEKVAHKQRVTRAGLCWCRNLCVCRSRGRERKRENKSM